jgi:uncharacterized protein involved in outer membrane biogenesis
MAATGGAMKKILLGAVGLLLIAALALAGYGMTLARRLDTPELKESLRAQAKATLGTDVRVTRMKISLLSGVTLEGIAIDSPAPFEGELLAADAFVLRYRLLPLLAGRFEVERLALEKPRLALAMDAKGAFNYEKLGRADGAGPATPPTAGKAAASAPAGAAGATAVPLRIVMKSLAVEDASIRMTDHTKASLMAVDGIDFRSAFEVAAGGAQGRGDVTIGTTNLGDVLFVRDARAPLTLSKEKVTLAPIRASVAGGTLTGDLSADLAGGFRFATDLALDGARVEKLLEEAQSAAALSGTLQAKAHFEGRGGLPTLRGKGSAQVAGCRAQGSKVLALLAAVLQVPELANPDFETCRVEFDQRASRFATPVVELKGDAVRLSGKGSLDLETSGLDYDMTLALSPALFAKVTRRELRGAFETRADGFAAVPFRLYGTTLEPKTDLVARLGKAAAKGVAIEQAGKLLKGKKLF